MVPSHVLSVVPHVATSHDRYLSGTAMVHPLLSSSSLAPQAPRRDRRVGRFVRALREPTYARVDVLWVVCGCSVEILLLLTLLVTDIVTMLCTSRVRTRVSNKRCGHSNNGGVRGSERVYGDLRGV